MGPRVAPLPTLDPGESADIVAGDLGRSRRPVVEHDSRQDRVRRAARLRTRWPRHDANSCRPKARERRSDRLADPFGQRLKTWTLCGNSLSRPVRQPCLGPKFVPLRCRDRPAERPAHDCTLEVCVLRPTAGKERRPTGPLRHEKRQTHLLPARCDRHVLDPVVLRERGQLRRIEWTRLDLYMHCPERIRRQKRPSRRGRRRRRSQRENRPPGPSYARDDASSSEIRHLRPASVVSSPTSSG
jgi:hypothetical protein